MSILYLQSILPLPEPPLTTPLDSTDTPSDFQCTTDLDELENLSDHDLGVLMARFGDFRDTISPLRAKLDPIEAFLSNFNLEIHHLSQTLLALEDKSSRLSTKADSRRDIVDRLNSVVLDLMIPPQLVESVIHDPIDELWLENIRFIAEKQQLIAKINHNELPSHAFYKDSRPFEQLQQGVDLLEAKAVERIRDHLINQIRLMRRLVKTSSQAVQEKLLQVKEIYAFLEDRHPALAKQLQLAYIYTMKWYYTTRFAKYLYALQKLNLKIVDGLFVVDSSPHQSEAKLGLFGFVDATLRDTLATSSPQASNRPSVSEYFLSYSKRIEILSESNTPELRRSIPSQIAETTPFAYWMEFSFNQWSNALLDNIIVEYLFMVDFFYRGSEKFHPIADLDPSLASSKLPSKDWSHFMFKDTYDLGRGFVSWLVTSLHLSLGLRIAAGPASYAVGTKNLTASCDSYAILIMIRLIQNQVFALHNEFRIPVMEDYHNLVLLMLWPHFTRIIDINCDAIKKHNLGSNSYSYRQLRSSQAPINATQQFAQFLVGLLKLAFVHDAQEEKFAQFEGEPVCSSIVRLRNDFESALTKTSTHVFGSGKSKSVQKEVFLFNNYFLVVTILRNEFELDSCNAFIKEQIEHFELLCDAYKPK